MERKRILFTRPRDKSLEAFKEWITGMVEHLTGRREDTRTEEEWIAVWKKFWGEDD